MKMKKVIFKEKYPIFTTTLSKSNTILKTTDEIIAYLKDRVEKHCIASYITVFDHYTHTKNLDGYSLAEGLLDAKNLIFCFGKEIPTPKILAVRPRSIGVCEFKDKFEICFLEAPKEALQKEMEGWIEELKNPDIKKAEYLLAG